MTRSGRRFSRRRRRSGAPRRRFAGGCDRPSATVGLMSEERELWREERAMPGHAPRGPSPVRCTPSGRTASCTPRRVRCVADARARGKDAIWRSGGSSRGATRSSTGVRRRCTASRATAARRASELGGGPRGIQARGAHRARLARPAHLHPPPPTVASHGSAATFGARPWNGATPVWTVASSSSRTSSGACPGCERAWAWRSR